LLLGPQEGRVSNGPYMNRTCNLGLPSLGIILRSDSSNLLPGTPTNVPGLRHEKIQLTDFDLAREIGEAEAIVLVRIANGIEALPWFREGRYWYRYIPSRLGETGVLRNWDLRDIRRYVEKLAEDGLIVIRQDRPGRAKWIALELEVIDQLESVAVVMIPPGRPRRELGGPK